LEIGGIVTANSPIPFNAQHDARASSPSAIFVFCGLPAQTPLSYRRGAIGSDQHKPLRLSGQIVGAFTLRFDIVDVFDTVHEIRDGSGIGVFAPCGAAEVRNDSLDARRWTVVAPGWDRS